MRGLSRWATGVGLLTLAIGCEGPRSDEGGAAPERAPLFEAVSVEPVLTPSLLTLEREGEIQAVLDERLTVDVATARAWAVGYAEAEMGYQAPQVRSVLPVEDSRGVLIAHQVVLSTRAGQEGARALRAELAPILQGIDPGDLRTPFQQIHEATAAQYFTVHVAAHRFRHPLRRAHRGVPRWLAESGEIDSRCQGAEPEAILPAAGLPGAVELVRYRCADGSRGLFSHHAGGWVPAEEVRTRQEPIDAFRRWSRRVRTAYDDPAARLAFTEDLWLRYLGEEGRP